MDEKKAQQLTNELYKKPKPDKGLNAPHYPQFAPNYYHQIDLLFLPHDGEYKYALVVADVGSKLVDARPLKTKEPKEIVKNLRDIYKGKILKKPTNYVRFDSGNEFKGEVIGYMSGELGVSVGRAKPGRHRQMAIVERKNKDIGRILFKRMTVNELKTGETSTEWVDYLPATIKSINSTTKKRKALKAIDPLKLDYINTHQTLVQGTKVRVALDQPKDVVTMKKLHGDFRETDIRWEIKIRTITDTIMNPGQPVMYVVSGDDGKPDTSTMYTRNQLQVVKE